MRLTIPVTVALLALAGPASAQHSSPCRHEADRSANIDAAGARLLELSAGSGSLEVVGKAGLTRVVIRARACASDAGLLAGIELDTDRDGSSIVVRANLKDNDWSGRRNWHENTYARLDVVVEVPAGMAAEIDDGSGEIELANLGDVRLEDGSGEIVAGNLASIRIEDGSGSITVADVTGDFTVDDDGSGSIDYDNVRGRVDIPRKRR